MPNKYIRILLAILLIVALVAVRYFEEKIFYDPLTRYFYYFKAKFPSFNETKLYSHIFLRYMINLLLTVLIIKVIFWKQKYVKFTIVVGIIGLIILLPLYAYQLQKHLIWGDMIFFYVRRFLIQPMFLIILIPCFYYQEIINKKALN